MKVDWEKRSHQCSPDLLQVLGLNGGSFSALGSVNILALPFLLMFVRGTSSIEMSITEDALLLGLVTALLFPVQCLGWLLCLCSTACPQPKPYYILGEAFSFTSQPEPQ